MKTKSKNKKVGVETIEIDSAELSLILEALKNMEKKVNEERFYRRDHPIEFYNVYLDRYWKLIQKLDVKIPRAVFLKMPKF